MRTKGQQTSLPSLTKTGDPDMFRQIKAAMDQSRDTLLQDAIGAASLVVMLVVALHLPGMI